MAKQVKARIQNKYDTEENWAKVTGFIPMAQELIVVTDNACRLKLGNGSSTVANLPYLYGAIPDASIDTLFS